MKKLIKMYNEKYGNTLGVIDDDFNKEQMYRIYYFIKNNCDDEEIQERLAKIKLDKPKTLEQQLTKLESENNKVSSGTIDPTIKSDIANIKTDLGDEELTTANKNVKGAINEVNAQYKDIVNKIENGNNTNIVYWENVIKPPYWILHVDCARKYFSISNLKILIDKIADNGFNQIQLHFSEGTGFRFKLDDMNFEDEDGTKYDLTPCLGGTENPTKWYSQDEMDELIIYANALGIDVVPSFDMPSHMGKILSKFPALQHPNSADTLNFTNDTAKKFAKAITAKYCKYFVSRGCKFYNIGVDEVLGWNTGFINLYNDGKLKPLIDFTNELIDVVENNGLIPRIFDEIVYYNSDYNNYISKDVEILFWRRTNTGYIATAQELQNIGYKVINANSQYYWVLNNSSLQVTSERLLNANLLTDFITVPSTKNGYGAMFSIWCDQATGDGANDGGDTVITGVSPLIEAFGEAITNTLSKVNTDVKTHSIILSINNATVDNTAKFIVNNEPYVTKITCNNNYTITSVSITMDGVDISNCYNSSTRTINIPHVTGIVKIKIVCDLSTSPKPAKVLDLNAGTITENSYISLDGGTSKINSSDLWDVTDYLDVEGYATIEFNKYRWDIFSCFNSNKEFIQHFSVQGEFTTSKDFTLPSNTKYVRINLYKKWKGTIEVKIY